MLGILGHVTELPADKLQMVHDFYNDAFTNLLWAMGGLIIFVGAIVPLVLQWIQRSSFKDEAERVKKEMRREMEEERKAIESTIEARLREASNKVEGQLGSLSNKLRKEAGKNLAVVRGAVHHVQAFVHAHRKAYTEACDNYVAAANSYILGNEKTHLQVALRMLVKVCLPNMDEKSFRTIPYLLEAIQPIIADLKWTIS